MTDIQAALGSSQMDRLDQYVTQRTVIAKLYEKKFKDTHVFPLVQKLERNSAHHLYVIRIKGDKQNRDNLYNYLRKNDIGVNLHYIPIYKHKFFHIDGFLKGAEQYYESAISLPIYPAIDNESLNKVFDKTLQLA
jgi:dTDP-4-amino-4,6-dideoxygalactose transaminase